MREVTVGGVGDVPGADDEGTGVREAMMGWREFLGPDVVRCKIRYPRPRATITRNATMILSDFSIMMRE